MSVYLEIADEMIANGLRQTSAAFRDAQRAYVLSGQHSSGAFCSPAGEADLYYTDFAVRALVLLAAEDGPLQRCAEWIAGHRFPNDEAHCFCYLNARRLLASRGIEIPPLPCSLPPLATESVYRLFLGTLCRDMESGTVSAGVADSLDTFRRPDGGFAESAEMPCSQTNATAAALGLLVLCEKADSSAIPGACDYLASRQCADGGYAAHAQMQSGDLLSSFTALLTLGMLGHVPGPQGLVALARFVRGCARTPGGFAAEPLSVFVPDAEYTLYGVALTALLRALLSA